MWSSSKLITVGACAYEIVAIASGTPTITRLVKAVRDLPGGKYLVWAGLGFVSWHFLVDDVS